MAEVRITLNDADVRLLVDTPTVRSALSRIAAELVREMKARCPVSHVQPVYASKGRTVPGGRRFAGDFPLRPSGFLRSSIGIQQQSDGSMLIGAGIRYRVSYAGYVHDGTVAHEIRSHGDYPLRNRATGQVFGRVVHHPGTRPVPFVREAGEAVAARHAGRPV